MPEGVLDNRFNKAENYGRGKARSTIRLATKLSIFFISQKALGSLSVGEGHFTRQKNRVDQE